MMPWLRKGLLVARTHGIRTIRELRDQPLLAALNVLPVVILGVVVVGSLPIPGYETIWESPGAYYFGGELARGNGATVRATLRGVAGVLFVGVAYLIVLSEVVRDGVLGEDIEDLLVVVGPRTIGVAAVSSYLLYAARLIGPIVLVGAVAFGIGAGSALAAGTLVLAGAALCLTAATSTYTVALAIRLALARTDRAGRATRAIKAALLLGMFSLFVWFRDSMAHLGASPLGSYAELGLVTVHTGDPVDAALALLATGSAVALAAAVVPRLGERVWRADDPVPQPDTESADSTGDSGHLERFVSRPVAAVTRVTWRRLAREPGVLVYSGLMIALTVGAGLAASRRVPEALPLIIAFYGTAAVGAGVTLNPLGNEGPALPVVLTTPDGERHLLAGYCLSAAIPGAVLVGVSAYAAGGVVEIDGIRRIGMAAVGTAFGVLGPPLAAGIGARLPQFEGVEPTRDSSMRPPHLQAVLVFLFALLALGTPALVAVVATGSVADATGLPPTAVASAGTVLSVGCLALTSWLSYRDAVGVVQSHQFGG